MVETCQEVPHESCTPQRVEPKLEKKPIWKKVCTPSSIEPTNEHIYICNVRVVNSKTGESVEGAQISNLHQIFDIRIPSVQKKVEGRSGSDGVLYLGQFPSEVELNLTVTAAGFDDNTLQIRTKAVDGQTYEIGLHKVCIY